METAYEISAESSLFEAIQQICRPTSASSSAMERRRITGIVTTADLSVAGLRNWVNLSCYWARLRITVPRPSFPTSTPKAELASGARTQPTWAAKLRTWPTLTLGEYIRLLENPESWDKLRIRIDRKDIYRRAGEGWHHQE